MSCFCVHSGGNEESEIYELQTAREWSEDEEGEDGDPDDDEGLLSSPSIWGTPRQNSAELTFSYFAIAEAEAVGASRHLRDRRRAGSRGSRTPLIRTDTLETLLDSPDVDWDPQPFLSREDDEASDTREEEMVEARTASLVGRRETEQDSQTETISIQPSPQNVDPETQGRDAGIQREETEGRMTQIVQPHSPSHSSQQQRPAQLLEGERTRETFFCIIPLASLQGIHTSKWAVWYGGRFIVLPLKFITFPSSYPLSLTGIWSGSAYFQGMLPDSTDDSPNNVPVFSPLLETGNSS